MVKLVLVGAGAWGKNLLRVARSTPGAALVAVVDPDPKARAEAAALAPGAPALESLEQALSLPLDAALIATPARAHAGAALAALAAGLDVFVEKPLAAAAAEAQRIASAARGLGRLAAVGHLLRYHPAVGVMLAEARRGLIGQPLELRSRRLSPPGRPSDVSALWALAPHDLSLLLALEPSPLSSIAAFCEPERAELRATGSLLFRASLSRVHPRKERVVSLVGSEGTLTFDDLDPGAPLTLRRPRGEALPLAFTPAEPLAVEIAHFVDCVATRQQPLTPATDGVQIARWLEAAEANRLKTPREAGLAEPQPDPGLHR